MHERDGERRHGGRERPLPAEADDLHDGPDRHDRGLDDGREAHRDEVLDLGYVVRAAVDERRRAEAVDVPAREVERLVEDLLAKGAREARHHAGGEVDADDVAHERACGAQHHVAALDEDLAHGGAGGLGERGDRRHVVGQGEVEPHLQDHEHEREQGLPALALVEVSEQFQHREFSFHC